MMKMQPGPRLRASPYYDATIEDGATMGSSYNRMILPVSYGDPEGEYWRTQNGVTMWDVAVERQVEITGPDADRLAQILCVRDLSKCAVGQGKYVAMCDARGTILNDPIAMKVDENHWWLSIADSDMMIFARAIAGERGLDVRVWEPDVSPLAVQGPLADDVVASIFGDWVRELKHFRFKQTEVDGIPLVLCRSGWSKQGGFELFLQDYTRGHDLWRIVREAGQPFDIGPGAPSGVERIEGGLLSIWGDSDDSTNPLELRMEPFVDLDVPDDTLGVAALRKVAEEGPKRRQLGLRLDGDAPDPFRLYWEPVHADGRQVGCMTCCQWSWRLGANIGYGLVEATCEVGQEVEVMREQGPVRAVFTEIPFL